MGVSREKTTGAREVNERARPRLSADDWASSALDVIAESGLSALSVEPLAARIGTTKGSFYWHFRSRQALVEAALARWESQHTEAIIARIDETGDPVVRLRSLLNLVVGYSKIDRIEVALSASAEDPVVAPVISRVTSKRIAYVRDLYVELGLSAEQAGRQAVLAVSVYLGHVQLAHAAPESLPDGADWRTHIDGIIEALMPPGVRGDT